MRNGPPGTVAGTDNDLCSGPRHRLLSVPSASILVRAQTPAAHPPAPVKAVDSLRDIQPIFEKYCAECHGRSKARAQLRLHAPEWIRKGGQSGPRSSRATGIGGS